MNDELKIGVPEAEQTGFLTINNGLDEVRYAPSDLKHSLARLLGDASITPDLVVAELQNFGREVEAGMNRIDEEGKDSPQHVGSSDLGNAIESLFYEQGGEVQPSKWGLTTPSEVKLLGAFVASKMRRGRQ